MTSRAHQVERADPVDRHVGIQIRLRRKQLGVTQAQLADVLGVTFQQVQKYERAANRVSASKLWEIGQALNAPMSYFYEGLEGEDPVTPGRGTQALLLSREGVELVVALQAVSGRRRRVMLNLIRELSAADD